MPARQLLAKIHIAKKECGLDDEIYRTMLENITGKRSAKELNDRQIIGVIKHFENLGWHGKTKMGTCEDGKLGKKKYDDQATTDPYAASPQIKRKIEAMWHDIYRGNEETKHLRQFLWNHFKISDIRFLTKDTAWKIIEGLKKMQQRRSG